MARIPKFTPVNGSKGWRVNVPESLSDSGKRCQRFFPTRQEATDFAKTLKAGFKEFGTQARTLSPGAAEDALGAMEILKDLGVTLSQCAQFYVKQHDLRKNSPTLAKAWEKGLELRKSLSPRHYQNLKGLQKRLPQNFKDQLVVEIDHSHISQVLTEITNGPSAWESGLRLISLILGDCVKDGTLKENPCKRVQIPKVRMNDEVKIYTVEELKALFAACRDYGDGLDRKCSECAVPFAFLAFAGIRPEELPRLYWKEVNLTNGYIRIGGGISKKGTTRNVRINETLRAWIESIPEDQREGKVVPGRWIQKATRVRKEAGLNGHALQDALRHSFASYGLAVEKDVNALKGDMGHKSWDVFFNHYHNAVTKEDAEPYWKILPLP